MSQLNHAPYTGPLFIDVQEHKPDLVDLPPGGTARLKREKDGFAVMYKELADSVPAQGAKAGIASEIYQRFVDRTATLEKIRQKRAEAEKLAEVLRETEIALENAREGDVAVMAKAIQTTAQHIDPTVTGTFENTLRYYSQIGDKAAATRRKNEEAKAEDATPPANPV
ncbi:hypothetical protein [Polyangium aurulentum]|uniref:hypothetical protein n=1 Tax=Polyangium aurulentum TaxID=2567896 RepID=UPI0010AE4322|nr:hypothetical protein [Polyangium aurulentum]UQA59496.1 hypothetical protein E8A73_003005 [Polyangium aurulentum]